jgi:malonyl CoA-acyl carrier protein transacylase
MTMRVFLFPGQGSQEAGMAADLFKADAPFRQLVRRASEHTGSDLQKICLRGPDRELTRTRNLQPLLVCVSLGYLRRLAEKGVLPDKVLGHSLGEISALAAAGIVSFEAAVDIAAKRGELMDAAAARAPGGMAAVISTDRAAVLNMLARKFGGAQVVLASDNAPNQIVVSGEVALLEQFASLLAAEKLGQCRRLAVAGAWHSPLMAQAQREFSSWLDAIEFRAPRAPLIFNVTAAPENDPQKIRHLIARNLVEPVRWHEAMTALRGAGGLSFYEVGPGRVLSSLARANGFGNETKIHSINSQHGIEMAGHPD